MHVCTHARIINTLMTATWSCVSPFAFLLLFNELVSLLFLLVHLQLTGFSAVATVGVVTVGTVGVTIVCTVGVVTVDTMGFVTVVGIVGVVSIFAGVGMLMRVSIVSMYDTSDCNTVYGNMSFFQ